MIVCMYVCTYMYMNMYEVVYVCINIAYTQLHIWGGGASQCVHVCVYFCLPHICCTVIFIFF